MPALAKKAAATPAPKKTAKVVPIAKPKPFKMPKTLAECGDALYELRAMRLEAQKVVAEIEKNEKALKERIINELPKSQASGIAGQVARVTIEIKDIPVIEDKQAFYAFIKKHNRFDLLQNRVSEAAVKEMWDDKKTVPGIGVFRAPKVSCVKK